MTLNDSQLSAGRFLVDYTISPNIGQSVESIANDICFEQTVEIPEDCVPARLVSEGIPGRIENIVSESDSPDKYLVTISFQCDLAVTSIPQFLNTLFGNISLKNNIRLRNLYLPESQATIFPGPSFGISEIRRYVNVFDRPITCTALKPVGFDSKELAEMAYTFALGGADVIKDDHGISNQKFARFEERVTRVQEAIADANARTGRTTLYCPMLNDGCKELERQIEICRQVHIKGALAAPALIGYSAFAELASMRELILMAHPAFAGTFFTTDTHGASPAFFLGTLYRLLGADISIFPNAGGRFQFNQQECDNLCEALRGHTGTVRKAFPAPAGGMSIDKIPQMIKKYGNDSVFIIGGNLFQYPDGLLKATRSFVETVEKYSGN